MHLVSDDLFFSFSQVFRGKWVNPWPFCLDFAHLKQQRQHLQISQFSWGFVSAVQVNFHCTGESFHDQHRDVYGAKQRAGPNCACSFKECVGTVCCSVRLPGRVHVNLCVFNRATVSETALKIDRVVYGSLVVGDELCGSFLRLGNLGKFPL